MPVPPRRRTSSLLARVGASSSRRERASPSPRRGAPTPSMCSNPPWSGSRSCLRS